MSWNGFLCSKSQLKLFGSCSSDLVTLTLSRIWLGSTQKDMWNVGLIHVSLTIEFKMQIIQFWVAVTHLFPQWKVFPKWITSWDKASRKVWSLISGKWSRKNQTFATENFTTNFPTLKHQTSKTQPNLLISWSTKATVKFQTAYTLKTVFNLTIINLENSAMEMFSMKKIQKWKQSNCLMSKWFKMEFSM